MSKEFDLSEHKVPSQRQKIDTASTPVFESSLLPEVATHLSSVVTEYNFDTFSFASEIIEEAEKSGLSLSETFASWKPNSVDLLKKHHGSNCAGLSLYLQQQLNEFGIKTFLAPSYGSHLITQEADDYAEIRTTVLLGLVKVEENGRFIFLAPGLTIDKPIFLRRGYQVDSFGSRFVVTQVDEQGFRILRVDQDGETREREFLFEQIDNPEESFQKNIMRGRTRYQMTRQYQDGHKDFITFDFPQRAFRVQISGVTTDMNPGQFLNYLALNGQKIQDVFNNKQAVATLQRFVENIDTIKNELLLPNIQTILDEIWKSS